MSFSYAFFKLIIKQHTRALSGYSIGLAAFGLLMALFFPVIKNTFEEMGDLIAAYPEPMRQAFGMELDSFATIEGFISVEYFSLFWLLILAIFIFSVGASLVAGEVDRTTADFSYTLPLKRREIVMSKFLGGFLLTLVAGSIGILSTLVGIYIVGETARFAGYGAFFLLATVLTFFLLGTTTFFSAIFNTRAMVYVASASIFAISYILHIFVGISDKIEPFYYLSFFKYYGSPETILLTGNLEFVNLFVLLLAGLFFLSFALYLVEKRDL